MTIQYIKIHIREREREREQYQALLKNIKKYQDCI